MDIPGALIHNTPIQYQNKYRPRLVCTTSRNTWLACSFLPFPNGRGRRASASRVTIKKCQRSWLAGDRLGLYIHVVALLTSHSAPTKELEPIQGYQV